MSSYCFRLCDPINEKNKKDVENLFETLAGNFAEIVQYNKDNRHYQSSKRSSVTLESLCDIMVNNSIITPVSNLLFFLWRYLNSKSFLFALQYIVC